MDEALRKRLRESLPQGASRRWKLRAVALAGGLPGFGRLPDAYIIGTQRGGTTSVYSSLREHPRARAALRKETEYLSWHYVDRGVDWYAAHFPAARRRTAFEATPEYIFHPWAPQLAAVLTPEARIVCLLRDPRSRAVSHYQHMKRLGLEKRTMLKAFRDEAREIDPLLAKLQENPFFRSKALLRYSYLARGDYQIQLERWYKYYPAAQVLVCRSEDFYAEPVSLLVKVCEFLGLDPAFYDAKAILNHSRRGRTMTAPQASLDTLPRDVRHLLEDRLGLEAERLEDLHPCAFD